MRHRQLRGLLSLAGLLIFLLRVPPAAAAIGVFHRTLHVSGVVVLRVNTASGSIHVTAGPPGEVHIVGHLHASGVAYGEPAAERVQRVLAHLPIRQKGQTIIISAHLKGTSYVTIDYDITAPRGTELEAMTGSGNLRLAGLGGPVKAFTAQGDISADGFTDHVWLRCGSGGIDADLVGANDVMAHTGSGGIRLRGVNGPLLADAGSGDLQITGRPERDWLVHTGYGQVSLHVGDAPFNLDATTGNGWISSKPAVSTHGVVGRHRLVGKVNGGGPKVQVETSYGDIQIR